jgi:hypothetical protein
MSVCPLLMASVKPQPLVTGDQKDFAKCLEKDCAWYLHIERAGTKPLDRCVIPQLGQSLIYISQQISARSK